MFLKKRVLLNGNESISSKMYTLLVIGNIFQQLDADVK